MRSHGIDSETGILQRQSWRLLVGQPRAAKSSSLSERGRAFETVFSAPDKVDFVARAKDAWVAAAIEDLPRHDEFIDLRAG